MNPAQPWPTPSPTLLRLTWPVTTNNAEEANAMYENEDFRPGAKEGR
ncbi:hypothetical protein [Dietzia natronolimnaea]|nr:hypothetical protein [Dietzia natronolimnaea]MBB1036725.1 hypothetical protein [Dietzia natronolimnaea]